MTLKKKKDTVSQSTNYFDSHNPKDHSTSYYRKEDFEKHTKMTPLDKIIDLRSRLRNVYLNQPTMDEIEKVLVHAIAEITNLQKRKSELEERVNQLLKENLEEIDEICDQLAEDFEKHKNDIEIHFNNEVVTIDRELSTQVVNQAVTEYITNALCKACDHE